MSTEYMTNLTFDFIEPVLIKRQGDPNSNIDNIIIKEDDLKKIIHQAYEAGKNSVGYIKPIQNTYPTSPHYWTEITCSNQGGLNE